MADCEVDDGTMVGARNCAGTSVTASGLFPPDVTDVGLSAVSAPPAPMEYCDTSGLVLAPPAYRFLPSGDTRRSAAQVAEGSAAGVFAASWPFAPMVNW